MSDLRLLTVHAHPDDEASKGASLVARYRAEGIGATLVTCTGGECGEVLNPAMDRPEVVADLPAVRRAELAAAVEVIGFDRCELLGYLDSGMPDTPENADPRNFWNAPIEESTERLVRIIRRDRPQVIVTYSDDQGHYPHPDHLRVHDISVLAFDRAGDAAWYPEAGEPFQPLKLYYTTWSRRRLVAIHEGLLRHHGESPFDEAWFERPDTDHRVTTSIDVGEFMWARTQALLAHATQVDPTERFWFGLSEEQLAEIYPWEDWILARSLVGPIPDVAAGDAPEHDLLSGIPSEVTA